MLRRIFYTGLFLSLSGSAFYSADPQPDVNLFGVMFLFFAYVIWFYWHEIQAGFAYQDERRAAHHPDGTGVMMARLGPFQLRELVSKKTRRP